MNMKHKFTRTFKNLSNATVKIKIIKDNLEALFINHD